MMHVNLTGLPLYETPMVSIARRFGTELNLRHKKEFDSQAHYFKQHVGSLNMKIEKALLFEKNILFVVGEERERCAVVAIFQGKEFSSTKDLKNMAYEKFSAVEDLVKPNPKLSKPFNFLSATWVAREVKGVNTTCYLAVAEFVPVATIFNFCIIN